MVIIIKKYKFSSCPDFSVLKLADDFGNFFIGHCKLVANPVLGFRVKLRFDPRRSQRNICDGF